MSAELMKPERPLFQSNGWGGGTPDEYQQAGIGYIAYCGVYEVDDENETVTHLPLLPCARAKLSPWAAAINSFERRPADFVCCCHSRGDSRACNKPSGMAASH